MVSPSFLFISLGSYLPLKVIKADFWGLDELVQGKGDNWLNRKSSALILIYLSFFIGALILAIGRTALVGGMLHRIIFFECLFWSLVP
jgi:hypothetical protein